MIQDEYALDPGLPTDGKDDALDFGRVVGQHGVLQRRADGIGEVGSRLGGVAEELSALVPDEDEKGPADRNGENERHGPQDLRLESHQSASTTPDSTKWPCRVPREARSGSLPGFREQTGQHPR